MKKFTWDDLAELINKLTPEQRSGQVCMQIEDESKFRNVEGVETIPQDIYVNNEDDEDSGELEVLKDAHGEDFKESDYRLATQKGTPFLYDEF